MRVFPSFSSTEAGASLTASAARAYPARGAGPVLIAGLVCAAALGGIFGASHLRSFVTLPQGGIVAPAQDRNFRWIERAIAECEAEAARNPETLYFMVIPVVPTDADFQAWAPKANGMAGASVILLGLKNTLDNLRAGSLRLDRRAFEFAILDPATSNTYKWRPAAGVHKYAIRKAKLITSFKPGFEMPLGSEPQWTDGSAIPRQAGTCYWTGALIGG